MESQEAKLLHSDLTEKILGVYYDVYNEIGHGFLESVYANCINLALRAAGVSPGGKFRYLSISAARMWDSSKQTLWPTIACSSSLKLSRISTDLMRLRS